MLSRVLTKLSTTGLALLLIGFSHSVLAQEYWATVADSIIQQLHQTQAQAKANNIDGAKQALVQAYYWEFEGSKMEAAMRTEIGAKPTYLLEKQFGQIRKALHDPVQLEARITKLILELRDSAEILDEAEVPANVFKVNQ